MNRTILIADDNISDREELIKILETEYDIIEADNGAEVLAVLKKKYAIISVVVLNTSLPVMDGFETLGKIRVNSNYLDVPVILASTDQGLEAKHKALEYGANGFMPKPYDAIIVLNSLVNLINIRENAAMVNVLSKDKMTGMVSTSLFFDECDKLIEQHEPGYYIMACIDIENFKVINDQYGMEVGNQVIRHVANCLSICYKELDGLATRFYADKFAVLYPACYANDPVILNNHKEVTSPACISYPIRVRIGRYIAYDHSIHANVMFERAIVAEQSLKGKYDAYIAEYTDSMLSKILNEQQIVNEMESALAGGQFIPFLQPQYNHATGALIGAEALVRWKRGEQYAVPGEFLPIFEKNGFIYKVDKYIWEQISILLRKWLDEGKNPLPISVNVSRYDLYKEDFFEFVCNLVTKYRLPADLLRLEVTESAFTDSPEHIIRMVNKLIEYGFVVEIDDFGSGYSSLNTLKDVPASILKLDMKFFSKTKNTVRSGNIIESVIRMANWLRMSVIAEGVEERKQADFLQSAGCVYVQGYLYDKPMPVENYERIFDNHIHEHKHSSLKTVSTLDNNLFWDPHSMETLIFNSYVGGACILEQYQEKLELIRVNNQYLRELGSIVTDEINLDRLNIVNYLDEDDLKTLYRTADKTAKTKREAACEVMAISQGNGKEYIQFQMRLIANTEERNLFYCVITNKTKLRTIEQKERQTADTLQAVMNHAGNGMVVVIHHKEGAEFAYANERLYEIIGYSKAKFHQEVEGNIMKYIHPDDREKVFKETSKPNREGKESVVEFRIIAADGRTVWIKLATTFINLYGITDPAQVVTVTDITKEQEANDQLTFLNDAASMIISKPNANEAIEEILSKLLIYLHSERVWIAEPNQEGDYRNTYEVCKDGIVSLKSERQIILEKVIKDVLVQLKAQEYMCVTDIQQMIASKETKKRLEGQGIHSFLIAPVVRGKEVVGLACVDNPKLSMLKLDKLLTITDYIAILLARRDMNLAIEHGSEAIHFLMEDTPGGFCRMRIHLGKYPEIIYANQGFCLIMGMDYDEIQRLYGTSAYDCIHPDDIPVLQAEARKNMYNGGQMKVECRIHRKDNHYYKTLVIGRFNITGNNEIYLNAYYVEAMY